MKDKLILSLGILIIIIGFFISFWWWFWSSMMQAGGPTYPEPLSLLLTGIILIIIGMGLLLWKKISKKENIIIMGAYILVAIVLIAGGIKAYDDYYSSASAPTLWIYIVFEQNQSVGTLMVTELAHPSGLWKYVEIESGNATLPTGYIDFGDVITNCSGIVRLVWTPSDQLLGEWVFT